MILDKPEQTISVGTAVLVFCFMLIAAGIFGLSMFVPF